MREAKPRSKFRRDLKRELRGIYCRLLDEGGEFDKVVDILADDLPLPLSYRDHPLHGDWEGARECHIRSNFLLVYRYVNDDVLILERLGSHSEIFGL